MPCVNTAGAVNRPVLLIDSASLKELDTRLDDPGLVFSAAQGSLPPFAPKLVSLLIGLSVAYLPVNDVSAAIGQPLTPENRRAALNALAARADLLR